jgi:hypothetical protein
MAPSKGRVIKKRFALICRPGEPLARALRQGRLVVDLALYPPPPERKPRAGKKR